MLLSRMTRFAVSVERSSWALFLCLLPALPLVGVGSQPNIVVMISDDGGYADWEFMDDYLESENPGQADSPVPTPHLNTLRDRGVLFTQGYTAPVCSPSRAAIVTGSFQQRIGYEYNINNLTGANAVDGLHPSTTTIFHRMKDEGYITGAIGKWHIGARANDSGLGNRPQNMAVDEFLGVWKGSRDYDVGDESAANAVLREAIASPLSDTVIENTAPWNTTYDYVTSAFGKGATDFIDRNYTNAAPFFLYVAFTAPHGPIHESPDFNDPRISGLSGNRKKYASMVITMDKEIGNIMDKLGDPAGDSSTNLLDNTLIFFINDNGGANGIGTVNTPLKGWKGSVSEGGMRVPFIMAGPGVPSNTNAPITYDKAVHSIDILPTCVEAAGGDELATIDGVNLIPYVDGTKSDAPHTVLTMRHQEKFGVRKGDWKLAKDGGSGAAIRLYDLSTDLSETNDLASVHTGVVAELLRDFTAFEVECEKPRHAGLGKGAGTINLNNQFRLNPVGEGGTPGPTGTNVVLNPGFENGTQGDADNRYTFSELDDWSNNGTNDDVVAAINNDAHSGTYRSVFVAGGRVPYQLTSHTIAGGETMFLDFWHKGKSGWNNSDTIDVELFYITDGGATQVLDSAEFNPKTSGWLQSTHLFPAISDASATGKPLGLRVLSNGGGNKFVSIDDVFLSTGAVTGGVSEVSVSWSETGSWVDTETGSADTLLTLDAFADAVLEFPVVSNFTYVASNDMVRMTGLDFMLNALQLSGNFAGTTPQSGTLRGNDLLFTDSLTNLPPSIDIAASGTGFSFVIENDLLLYEDLSITGDGDVGVEITGTVKDYYASRGVNKSGNSTVLLSGAHTYSGSTTISGGTFLLNAGGSLQSSNVVVESGGALGGSGSLAGSISGSGTVSPGLSIGTLSVMGNASFGELSIEIAGATNDLLDVSGTLDITGSTLSLSELGSGVTDTVYIVARYGALNGRFNSVVNLPSGYRIDYRYDDGSSSNNIAVVPDDSATRFMFLISSHRGEPGVGAKRQVPATSDPASLGYAG